MKYLTTALFITILQLNGISQKLDSISMDGLLKLLETSTESKEKIDVLSELSARNIARFTITAKDSAIMFSTMATDLARETNDSGRIAKSLYDESKYYISESNLSKATPCLLESLDLFTALNNDEGASDCHMQLGLISYLLQYFEDAIRNLKISVTLSDNPTSNYLLALSYTELDSFSTAKEYFSKSIVAYKNASNNIRLNECYLWLGRLYLKMNMLDSSFIYLKKNIDWAKNSDDPNALIRPYAFVSKAYMQLGDLDQAINYAEQCYKLESSKSNATPDNISLIEATETLSKSYAVKGDYQKAYFFLDLFHNSSNKFAEGSIKQKVADMQSMFEFEKEMSLQKISQQKDKEVAEQIILREKLRRNALLIGLLLLLTIVGVLYNRYLIRLKSNKALRLKNKIISTEKERSDSLLLNILPREIAEELKTHGVAESKLIDHVTVIFTDFKDFTIKAKELSPKELVADIHIFFSEFDKIMEKYGIEKIKTIGDSYMAAGGLPIPNKTHAADVVKAAIEIRNFIRKSNAEKQGMGLPYFEIRIGVHTGPVVAGIVGFKKFTYDIWGDTVNTASRMESMGVAGKVNISSSTYELLKDYSKFKFEYRGKFKTKGKGEIDMYFVEER